MAILTVMCGLPGSGKTDYTKHILCDFPEGALEIVSMDGIREELCGDASDQSRNTEVFNIAMNRISNALSNDRSIIYDATNVKRTYRRDLIKRFGDKAYMNCIFIDTPIEECIKRDANRARSVGADVIERMSRNLSTPTIDEGWDQIAIIRDGKLSEKLLKN